MADEFDLHTAENMKTIDIIPEIVEDPDESKKRRLSGWQFYLVAGIAITASCFHLYTAAFGLFAAMTQRAWHWMFMGTLLFLIYPVSQKKCNKMKIDIWDWIPAALMIIGCANILLNYDAIAAREGAAIPSDIYLGVVMIVLVIEGARRAMGWPLPIMAILALCYGVFGPYMPGIL
ncbi:MAG: C4-dicarboxylate ABC transporter permease, partial [Synergistaceae bacterium]|nr:C4-dicarboxylate ABC transporter permease [Synergistaceae bacterium]